MENVIVTNHRVLGGGKGAHGENGEINYELEGGKVATTVRSAREIPGSCRRFYIRSELWEYSAELGSRPIRDYGVSSSLDNWMKNQTSQRSRVATYLTDRW